LRDYGVDSQIGLEESPEAYVNKLVEVFREVRRVLKKEGTLWLNLGSSYINKKIESEEMVLRDNLTYDEMQYIFQELLKNVKNLP
jgi:DNA modification methylase